MYTGHTSIGLLFSFPTCLFFLDLFAYFIQREAMIRATETHF